MKKQLGALTVAVIWTTGCGTTVDSGNGGVFIGDALSDLGHDATADGALSDGSEDSAQSDSPQADSPHSDSAATDASEGPEVLTQDHCSGAKAGDGTYCGTSFDPPAKDAAQIADKLFTCIDGHIDHWVKCDSGCESVTPGKDTCAPVIVCGDGTCNGGETCSACPQDCGTCPDPCGGAYLGDGVYCGASLQPASPDINTLYTCKAKKTASSQVCANGCFVAPKGTADSCKPGPTTGAKGKGVWVWKFDSSAPSAQQVAMDAQAMGVGFVLIKTGQDLSSYDTNFNASVVSEFTSRGIEVYGWPYVTPGNNIAKAAVIAKAAKIPGVSGIILDVEVEYVKHDVDAVELCDEIRKQAPGVFLGYTSFGWISYHLDFPFEAFDQACGDAFLPQVYWDLWSSTTPAKSYALAVKDAKTLGLKAPMWAAQDNEMDPSATDLNAFFAVAGPRASLWRWPGSDSDPQFSKMQQLNWAN